jgi:hypothetical protein
MADDLTEPELHAVELHRAELSQQKGYEVGFEEALNDWRAHHAQHWREARQAEMLAKQREEIQRHKWIESEKAHRDLGVDAILDWIRRYAPQWRAWYDRK